MKEEDKKFIEDITRPLTIKEKKDKLKNIAIICCHCGRTKVGDLSEYYQARYIKIFCCCGRLIKFDTDTIKRTGK